MPLLEHIPYEKFAQHYANHGHLGHAAEHAGAPNTRVARMWLRKPEIAARIEEIVAQPFAKAHITAERTMKELARIAYSDVRDLYDENGDLKPIPMLDDDTAAVVSRVDVELVGSGRGAARTVNTVLKIRMADKLGALGILAKHFKIVGEDDDGVNALANALASRLKQARQRAANALIDDAVVYDAEAKRPAPGARLEYAVPGDTSVPGEPPPGWEVVPHDPDALHSPHAQPVPRRAAPAPAAVQVAAAPAPGRADDVDYDLS